MHWLGRSAKRCLPEGEDTVMVLGARDKHEPPAAGDRGCWHRWGVFSPKSEPRWEKHLGHTGMGKDRGLGVVSGN